MKKVITYGTYDLFHYGHFRLLERAKELGDYLIVGVTSDDYDKTRGKINVRQSLIERIENVRLTGLADEIIVEEYEGQKIDDILRYNVDIFTVGSDWTGKFDYLNEFCKVVYLDRTQGISSTELRSESGNLRLGLVGEQSYIEKYFKESCFVNGAEVVGVCTKDDDLLKTYKNNLFFTKSYDEILEKVDAVYIASHPSLHFEQVERALIAGKHVLCESPIALSENDSKLLFDLASSKKLVLMDAIKTAYSTAYNRLLVLLKSGKIGKVLSVDTTCTSLLKKDIDLSTTWNSICEWGPTALLPIFQILGVSWLNIDIASLMLDSSDSFDLFTKINFTYEGAVASLKVGNGVKSEGELIVSGTRGYVYVPAPWWKMDYFEIRYENQGDNMRYFYQLDGEGIRYELVAFVKAVGYANYRTYVDRFISEAICKTIEQVNYKDKHFLI